MRSSTLSWSGVPELIDVNGCMERGLLRRIAPSKEKALQCTMKSSELLGEARACLDNGQLNAAVLSGYTAILNAGRAVLFRDGWRERSHECVIRYLEANYGGEITPDTVALLERYKKSRHDTQYDVTYSPDEAEVASLLEFARGFIKTAGRIIEKAKKAPG